MEIVISALPVPVKLGYFQEERVQLQDIIVSLRAELLDDVAAAKTDDLALTVDYGELVSDVRSMVAHTEFKLVETIVWTLGTNILRKYSFLKCIDIEVVKQQIPKIDMRGARVSVRHLFKR